MHSLSDFVAKYETYVTHTTDYGKVVTWKDLKAYWARKFRHGIKSDEAECDFHNVDWDKLASIVNKISTARKLDYSVEVAPANKVEQRLQNIVQDSDSEEQEMPNLILIKSKLSECRQTSTNSLLKEGILDFGKRKPKGDLNISSALGPAHFKAVVGLVEQKLDSSSVMKWNGATADQAKSFVRAIFKNIVISTVTNHVVGIKDATEVKMKDTTLDKWQKTSLDLVNVYVKQLKERGNMLERRQTEYNYIMSFWYPEDRTKIAINLKKMFKHIVSTNPNCNPTTISNIVLLGLHVYRHHLHVYAMAMPISGVFAFKEVMSVALPCKYVLASKSLPKFIHCLWSIASILEQTSMSLDILNSGYGCE
ncbi:hypothetical protein DM01DRAFT_1408838 [Hesseltinella vesiculosa]|uniref:Uncharacterized protein n=1 Tax=Hesseltinella vesiculosa TaxID=101127 RepID=A0A1X2GCN7_9FUNG|nr:hypothetical protein DM01DRAFT_1408838 [Hesseltinella vesiculosa]